MPERFDPDEVARFRVAIARITKGVDRVVTADGLTRTQLSVLSTIARLGPVRPGELAQLEGVNPTMLSRLISALEDRGLVHRSPDPHDKRVTHIAASATGRALHQRLRRERTSLFTRHLRDVGPDQAAALIAALPALEALSASMSVLPDDGRAHSGRPARHTDTARDATRAKVGTSAAVASTP